MLKVLSVTLIIMILCCSAPAVERRHGILVGAVLNLDSAAKTVVVKLADGTEHTLHFVTRTTVHGTQNGFHGLKKGSEVAVHYTAKGAEETAEEIDYIGKDGLKATEGTVTHIDRGAKLMSVKTSDGSEETYRLTDSAARDAGKDIAEGSEKSAKVTVYYTEESGQKVAHFFRRII